MPNIPKKKPFDVPDFLVSTMSRVGISGTVIVFVMLIFWWYGTDTQKQLFIDKYILFKDIELGNNFPHLLIGVLVILFFINWYFYHKKTKLMGERIEELKTERDTLQISLLKLKK